jgi:16S rRNA (cytosine1402-N4)-methyltransferase
MKEAHIPVLLHEVIENLAPKKNKNFVDATCGFGGHAEAILKEIGPRGVLIGIDQDNEALESSRQKLSDFKNRFRAYEGNFSEIDIATRDLKIDGGILADLGISSYQVDEASRGFSFAKEGPLDMRMDMSQELTAQMVVNGYPVEKLTKILRNFADERFASRIVERIDIARTKKPIKTTTELAEIVWDSIPKRYRQKGINPATRTFQALRIEVNNELGHLKEFLPKATSLLEPGARIAVITFHSREDKIVANYFKEQAHPCKCPPDFPECVCGLLPKLQIVNRKSIQATEKEMYENPRSRSARLRVAEKI